MMKAPVQTADTSPTNAGALATCPVDDARAAWVVAGFQRIQGQRIVLGTAEAQCTVFGRHHRRPVEFQVPLSTALGLARRGVHTVVRVSEA